MGRGVDEAAVAVGGAEMDRHWGRNGWAELLGGDEKGGSLLDAHFGPT